MYPTFAPLHRPQADLHFCTLASGQLINRSIKQHRVGWALASRPEDPPFEDLAHKLRRTTVTGSQIMAVIKVVGLDRRVV